MVVVTVMVQWRGDHGHGDRSKKGCGGGGHGVHSGWHGMGGGHSLGDGSSGGRGVRCIVACGHGGVAVVVVSRMGMVVWWSVSW